MIGRRGFLAGLAALLPASIAAKFIPSAIVGADIPLPVGGVFGQILYWDSTKGAQIKWVTWSEALPLNADEIDDNFAQIREAVLLVEEKK